VKQKTVATRRRPLTAKPRTETDYASRPSTRLAHRLKNPEAEETAVAPLLQKEIRGAHMLGKLYRDQNEGTRPSSPIAKP
jgi:hypothetical protein